MTNKHEKEHFNEKHKKEEEVKDSKCECGCEQDTCSKDCDCTCQEENAVDYLDMLKRVQAEFDNYRKRNAELEKSAKIEGVLVTASKFLPVLDSFAIAKKHNKSKEFLEGIEPIVKQFEQILKELKIEKIKSLGEKFNADYHYAIVTENNDDKEDNEILEVFQDGYKLGDKILRYAMVKVNKKK